MRDKQRGAFLVIPFLETALKKVIHRNPWQSSVSKISSKKWGISDHSCLSLLYKQNKEISTLLLQNYNIPHSTTPHRHIALLGIIAALSKDFSLPPISITRVVSGQSWHFQGSFN